MTVTATAKRRRRQAVNNYRHLARLGHGNNNRPIYHKRSVAKQKSHEEWLRERAKEMALRKAARR